MALADHPGKYQAGGGREVERTDPVNLSENLVGGSGDNLVSKANQEMTGCLT